MKRRLTEYHFDGLIALTLFGVFAVCVLIVLLTGADAYRRLVVRGDEVIDRNACVQYISTRVRQAANPKEVAIEDFGEGNSLVLPDKNGYGTRVITMTVILWSCTQTHPCPCIRGMESALWNHRGLRWPWTTAFCL